MLPLALRRATSWWIRNFAVESLIFLLGVAVRVIDFGQIPGGLNQDEASLGYDAYAILHFGIDRHAVSYPAFLIGWGSGMNALSAYLAIPAIAIWGLTERAVRSVNLVAGVLTLAGVYWLTHLIATRRLARIALLLIAICPWHIMMSRWALESNLFPAVFLFGVVALLRGLDSPRWVPLSCALFAVSLYAYGTSYFAVPLFLLFAAAWALLRQRLPIRMLAAGVFTFGVIALPIAAVIVVNQLKLPTTSLAGIGIPRLPTVPRYQLISSLFGPGAMAHLGGNLAVLFRICTLQDDGLIWNAIPGYGLFYPIGSGLFLIGALTELREAWKCRLGNRRAIMILWLMTGLALAAIQNGNINRLNLLWIPALYFIAAGVEHLTTHAWVYYGVIAVHLALFISFCSVYFGPYRDWSDAAFYTSFGDAIRFASKVTPDTICVTDSVSMSYVFVLFYEKTDPHVFHDTVRYDATQGEFQSVKSFSRYRFGTSECGPEARAFVVPTDDVQPLLVPGRKVVHFARYSVVYDSG